MKNQNPEWRAAVEREKDAILVQFGADVEAIRQMQRLTVGELAKRAGLSKRAVVYARKTQGDPKLSTLIAQFRALGRRLVVTCERLEVSKKGSGSRGV